MALWWGATNGGVWSSVVTSPIWPVTERMACVSRASSRLSGTAREKSEATTAQAGEFELP